jgi:glycosyltransferase involved in cell wall biosynthesis
MACGKPVIASRLGGIREVISSRENGLLVDPANASEFAEAIIMLLKDQKLLDGMAQQACRHVRKYFSWDAIAKQHIELYYKYMSMQVHS